MKSTPPFAPHPVPAGASSLRDLVDRLAGPTALACAVAVFLASFFDMAGTL